MTCGVYQFKNIIFNKDILDYYCELLNTQEIEEEAI